jgi:glutathione peroxidase
MLRRSGIYELEVLDRNNQIVSLSQFVGKICLLTNLASLCSQAPMNMGGFKQLVEHYRGKPFHILGFPCKSFHQEPKEACQVAQWAEKDYGLPVEDPQFHVFGHVQCKGSRAHPVFLYAAEGSTLPQWNYAKYLIDPQGFCLRTYPSHTDPMQMVPDIDALMKKLR